MMKQNITLFKRMSMLLLTLFVTFAPAMADDIAYTTDAASPSTFIIYEKIGSNKCWTYTTEGKVQLKTYAAGNLNQVWYFTGSASAVSIVPYSAATKVLGHVTVASITGGAADKILAVTSGTEGYTTTFTFATFSDSYTTYPNAFQSNITSTYYLNFYGGGDALLGYNSAPTGDNTRFKLTAAGYTHSYAHARLNKLYTEVVAAEGTAATYGTTPGYYNDQTKVTTFNTTLTATKTMIDNAASTDAEYDAQWTALSTAWNDLGDIVMPTAGSFYILESAKYSGNYAYATTTNTGSWMSFSGSPVSSCAIWQFEANGSNYYLKNLHTGGYVNTAPLNTQITLGSTQGTITLTYIGSRQFNIKTTSYPLNAATVLSVNEIVGYSNSAIGSGSAWYIKEVTSFKQSVVIGSTYYATLCLNYPVTVPSGVTASYVTASGVGTSGVTLTEVGSVIPANTAVILHGDPGTYSFVYTTETNANATTIANDNILHGTLVDSYIAAGTSTCYALAVVNSTVGLYQVTLNVDGTGATGTTHFLNNANKAYMSVASGSSIKGFTFKLDDPTGIEMNTVEQKDNSIYDLTGRRVEKVTSTGLYIVNGKKFFIKK